jgi:SAM-dependent methyltransferase
MLPEVKSMKPVSANETRSPEEIKQHYVLEKKLAEQLRKASSVERKQLYPKLYAELFERVPYFSQRKSGTDARSIKTARQTRLISRFTSPEKTFMEIGAGDCALSIEMCKYFKRVYAIDLSNQISEDFSLPANFQLLISDGTSIDVPPGAVNIAYSNQLMEHLHPDDARGQLENIFEALSPGGIYIILTPHMFSGPHDISKYFDDVATGFHLKEYTNHELFNLLKVVGFSKIHSYAKIESMYFKLPIFYAILIEYVLRPLPYGLRKHVFRTFPFRNVLRIRISARK